jgi:hypothetical protein
MATNVTVTAQGVSPLFVVTGEALFLDFLTSMRPVEIDGVLPPWLGEHGGPSYSHTYVNKWFPWIDEKICHPLYDGVCRYLGLPSNRPTPIKDYHILTLFRATDYILHPHYEGVIQAKADGVLPLQRPPVSQQ